MATTVTPWAGPGPVSERAAEEELRAGGLRPSAWGNQPGDTYGWHVHGHDKVLYCVDGSVVFHTEAGDVPLAEGDRMDLPAGTRHAATVGTRGVRCVEAAADPPSAG